MTTTPAASPHKPVCADQTGADQTGADQTGTDQTGADELDRKLKAILSDVLGLAREETAAFGPETGLFGHLPELDSMAVAGLLTEIEDRMSLVIEDDDVDGEMLETYGALLAFLEAKIATR